jgi:hypothetical protein
MDFDIQLYMGIMHIIIHPHKPIDIKKVWETTQQLSVLEFNT